MPVEYSLSPFSQSQNRTCILHSSESSIMLGSLQAGVTRMMYGKNRTSTSSNFYTITDKLIDGKEISMKEYAGSPLVVVNVASK